MTPPPRHLVVGTAGHIDHGKTALLKALTGIDADRLQEEKDRGITIDIGFAPWLDPPYAIGFVDVPGHERFIKNMLAGSGGIDAVLLVVAADEGVMPQTREHLDIVSLLGIRRGLVALTKCDAVETELADLAAEDVRELVTGTFLADAPILRTSAVTGQGLPELRDELRRLADTQPERPAGRVARLFIDRVFVAHGFGAVVTGTAQGVFRRNDPVLIHPGARPAKLRSVQVYGRESDWAGPGQRAALNLSGVDRQSLDRGMAVTETAPCQATRAVFAHLHLLKGFGRRVRSGLPVHVYLGSAEVVGRVHLLETPTLEPGTSALVRLQLESPVLAWPGDRFVIRQYSPLETMGGGAVLEIHPPRVRRAAQAETLARLRRQLTAAWTARLFELIDSGEKLVWPLTDLVDRSGLAPTTVGEALRGTAAAAHCLPLAEGESWVGVRALTAVRSRLLAVLHTHFNQQPFSPGIRRSELRSQLPGCPEEAVPLLLERMAQAGEIQLADDRVSLAGRGEELPPSARDRVEQLGRRLTQAGLEGIGETELRGLLFGSGRGETSLLDWAVQRKRVVRVAEDYYLSPAILDDLVRELRQRAGEQGAFGVPQFKDWFGLTRRRAIPLLEHLDRRGVSVRVGDTRRLRRG